MKGMGTAQPGSLALGGRVRAASTGMALIPLLVLMLGASSAAANGKGAIQSFGGTGSGGGQLQSPTGIATNLTTGDIYVADTGNNRVSVFDSSGAFLRAWGMNVVASGPDDLGTSSFEICLPTDVCQAGAEAPATGGSLGGPRGVAVNQSTGNVYVTDGGHQRIQEFDEDGNFLAAFGWNVIAGGASGFEICTVAAECETGTAGARGGQFGNSIPALALGPSGEVVVADATNRRVQKFAATGEFQFAFGWDVNSAGGSGELETCTTTCQAAAFGPNLGQFFFGQPTRIAVDSSGSIYTVDSLLNNRVQKFNSAGTSVSLFAPEILSGTPAPGSIAADPDSGHLYVMKPCTASTCPEAAVSFEQRIDEITTSGSLVGQDAVNNAFTSIAGLTVEASGDLLVTATQAESRVYRLGTTGPPEAIMSPVTTFGGTTATFEGEVNPTGLLAGFHFEYSKNGVDWTKAPEPDADVGFSDNSSHPVSESVSGLTGSQLYHVRLAADKRFLLGTAIAASATSSETTFSTLPAKPALFGTAATQISGSAATLTAQLNPQNEPTTFHFEYGTEGPCDANPCSSTPNKSAGSGGEVITVAQGISDLEPERLYHFRLAATNATGTEVSADSTFFTRPASCPNEAARVGPSANLPDCRAYELVTPPDTNGVRPGGLIDGFNSPGLTLDGSNVIYHTGVLKGTDATGVGDVYEATRTSSGWTSSLVSPSAKQSSFFGFNGVSADHDYAFWTSTMTGTPSAASYVRYPDGSYQLLGQGGLATDNEATGRWISTGGQHIIFTSLMQLEPEAPENVGFIPYFEFLGFSVNYAVDAVYDRTPSGLEVVSLLPGDETPPAGASTFYRGTSYDGSSVVFNVDGTMYVRREGTTKPVVTTFEPGEIVYEGTSRDGTKVFYLRGGSFGGELFAFDYASGSSTQISSVTDARVVNVSADGSHVYFESTEQINGEGTEGEPNLYVWTEASIQFIGTLGPGDINLESSLESGQYGLVHWAGGIGVPEQINASGLGGDPSRTTSDGAIFVFESRANLTSYDSGGHSEIYRYVAATDSLSCVSCNKSGAPAVSDAILQGNGPASPAPELVEVRNMTDDGKIVFFMSSDALVPEDTDGVQDVYEWKEGTVSLISSGRSTGGKNWLFGVSADGQDVVFQSTDILVPQKYDETPAFYDAKVNGGFAPPSEAPPCVEESCQGPPAAAPTEPSIGSRGFVGPGNRSGKKPKCNRKRHKHCRGAHKHRKRHHQNNRRHAQSTGRAGR